jgi:hypothetical protein
MIRKIVEIVGTMQKLTLGNHQLVCLSAAAFEELVELAEKAIDLQQEVNKLNYEIYKLNLPKKGIGEARRDNPDDLLSQKEVAAEWGISVKTLEAWRWTGGGPPYIKLGKSRRGIVRYRRRDVNDFVGDQHREHTSHDTAIREAKRR